MNRSAATHSVHLWDWRGRALVFALAAMSIWCLLSEFYGLCSMRTFAIYVLTPATILLAVITLLDWTHGDGTLAKAVVIGAIAGLLAAVAYDVFRLPFVYSNQWGLSAVIPPMNLYKAFPRFGAMLLAEPIEQKHYSPAAQALGWLYHFSNGATFGIMFTAMIGKLRRRTLLSAIAMAAGLELAMLFTPYPRFFGITVTAAFVAVTLTAHGIFGLVLGWWTRILWTFQQSKQLISAV